MAVGISRADVYWNLVRYISCVSRFLSRHSFLPPFYCWNCEAFAEIKCSRVMVELICLHEYRVKLRTWRSKKVHFQNCHSKKHWNRVSVYRIWLNISFWWKERLFIKKISLASLKIIILLKKLVIFGKTSTLPT